MLMPFADKVSKKKKSASFPVLRHPHADVLGVVGLTQVAQQGQQVLGVAEPKDGQSEGHLGRKQSHEEVLDKLSSQTLLYLSHVGRHVVW